MRKPTKLKEIQQLTGRVAALSRFVARLGEKALPFYALIKQGEKFQWNEEADRAFENLKRTISTPPILVAPKEKEPLLLYIAATPQVRVKGGKRKPKHGSAASATALRSLSRRSVDGGLGSAAALRSQLAAEVWTAALCSQLPPRRCGRRKRRQEMAGTAALYSSCEAPALRRRRQEASGAPGWRVLALLHGHGVIFRLCKENPSNEIFSELDEINAQVPILPEASEHPRVAGGGHGAPDDRAGAAQALAAPPYGDTASSPLRLRLFAYIKVPDLKHETEEATVRETFQSRRHREAKIWGTGVSVPAPCRTGKCPEGFSIDTAAISTAIFITACLP
ncbi:hypothetical protein QYE76_017854 [Lolium multiflorum]|uniref:Reverse transcriptase/retrotransposon-derived protein RNase H-like domain-containing protein n=1 Tax=Lolium multiflorum TaxID=4521 RepID=A0AAD8UUW3_LOLMU|nr:hypothetical protein QYE76_017854 [Lolium multiflorum]